MATPIYFLAPATFFAAAVLALADFPTSAPQPATSAPATESKNIEGLKPGERGRNPYCEGLSIILTHLKHPDADYIRLMGYSGVAFTNQMALDGPIHDGKYDCAWWPNDCYTFAMQLPFLAKAYGRDMRSVQSANAPDRASGYTTFVQPHVIASIDLGLPALGQDDSAYVITGYDTSKKRALGFWPSPGQPYFKPKVEGLPWGLFVLGEKREPLSRKEAELQSLRGAVAIIEDTAVAASLDNPQHKWWNPKVKDPASNYLTGQKAFARWLELLADDTGLGRNSWDNNMMIHLRYNRKAAVAYLRLIAPNHGKTASEHLEAAATLYEKSLAEANRAPFWGQSKGDPAKKKEYTDAVHSMADFEKQAVEEIKKALAAK